MQIPDTAIKYILFQRTAYLRFPKKKLYRLAKKILFFSIYDQLVNVEALIGKERVRTLYELDMQNEYNLIKDYLPVSCTSILDIGCGVAGIDVFIHQHYKNDTRFYLLDKTRTERRVYYGFKQKGAFYNSLSVAKDLLCLNGVPESNIKLLETTDTNEINIHEQIDLIISLASWGFHYPVSVYLEKTYELLSDNGKLILDTRKNSDGLELLGNRFKNCEIISDQRKYFRVLCTK